MKQLVCVKWGQLYDHRYVNNLYAMLTRHVSPPFKLVCLTDDNTGIRGEVDCHPLPDLGCAHPQRTMGKWRKQVLWDHEVPGLETGKPALFIDLDSVIVDSLDPYFSHGRPEDVILARNWAKPLQRLGQTSVFRFPVGGNPQVLAGFRADPQGVADKYQFEQHWVTHAAKGGIQLWPEAWTCHFRLHCLPMFPLRYLLPARVPAGARIVTFPGGPNPDDVLEGRWNKRVPPHRSRWEHLLATFSGPRVDDSRWRHLQRYVLPVPWIAHAWREAPPDELPPRNA